MVRSTTSTMPLPVTWWLREETYLNTALGIGLPRVASDSESRRAGIEMQLGWRDNIGDFKYDVAANFTVYNTLWALREDEGESDRLNPYRRNQQIKENYLCSFLYKNLGYYVSAEDVYNSVGIINSYNSGNLSAGDLKYLDVNGDGQITSEDQRRLGRSATPHNQFGININLSYKGFYFEHSVPGLFELRYVCGR